MTQPPNRLLTIEQAAEWTGLTVKTLYRYRQQDTGPESFMYAGRVVYELPALERWIEDQRAATKRGGRVTV
ncbi:DNA-binding protein [Mycobacteroides abscessus]|uniref:helix-turn-helix transcriptional regulator n=1 Tax=Mycobacteroides abscessus TaxID=36809 RepID=UPI000C25E0AB|nr:helix-turn-helix domain-containing protein [Mycobacteroides abscessus]AWG51489.1 DNA-binding protein [Mycobacteroides abscessus]